MSNVGVEEGVEQIGGLGSSPSEQGAGGQLLAGLRAGRLPLRLGQDEAHRESDFNVARHRRIEHYGAIGGKRR